MGGFPARHEPAVTSHPASSPSSAPVSIKQEDLIQSVADALQYISYYHPVDYIRNLAAAWDRLVDVLTTQGRACPQTPADVGQDPACLPLTETAA